jgi:cystathionine beta-lyase
MKTATQCVYHDINDEFGATSPPIYQTATFRQETTDEFGEYDYSRSGNPTRSALERKLAQLEHGKFASAFSSGMAAVTTVARILESGDEIIAGDDLYGGTVRLFEKVLPKQGISVKYVDTTDAAAVKAAITDRTRLILVETPSNPLLRITDIRELANIAHLNGAWLAVDNSMLSPVLQNPLDLGADIVLHSATKFLGGHGDLTAGAVITNDAELHRQIAFIQNAEGNALAPFDSWLLLRGIKTLSLRVERQNSNAQKVAEFLSDVKGVKQVFYPGLKGHERNAVHASQASGGGAVVCFSTGDREASKQIAESLGLFSISVSFGSTNSTVSLPCNMSHASIPAEMREKLAPPTDLIRLSIGIEDVDDIIEDLEQALASTFPKPQAAPKAASLFAVV